jgi:GNAT superfamily N-acetyltransferase
MIAREGARPANSSIEYSRELSRAFVTLRRTMNDNEPAYSIRLARHSDLAFIPAIELAAARLLEGHAPESVLAEATSEADLDRAHRAGHVWVAVAHDRPVGFAHVEVFEPRVAHLDELDVHPDHGRRGLGHRLVTAVCAWATGAQFDAVTLCTFRDVPWNRPFYETLGFEVVPSDALSPALAAVVDDETRRGLDPARRVVMRRPLPGGRSHI